MVDESFDVDGLFNINTEESTVNIKALKEKIKALIINLLKREHSDPRKHDCTFTGKGLQFACPICGDSDRNGNKKRGHIYFGNNFYKCYNEDACKMSLTAFLEKFNIDEELTNMEISSLQFISDRDGGISNTARIVYGHGKFKEHEHLFFSRKLIYSLFGLVDIEKSPRGLQVVKDRRVPQQWWKYLAYNRNDDEIAILNCNKEGDRVLGFQRRLLRPNKAGLRYLSMTYRDIILDHVKVEDPDMKTVNFLDKLGGFFNIMNIDWNRPIPVFEGAFDAMMLDNSLATLSASNDIKHPNFYYTYDDDDTGRGKAYEKVDMGFKVFMWKKFKDDNPDLRRDKNNKEIKDFNQLFKTRILSFAQLMMYYTDQPLHKLYI